MIRSQKFVEVISNIIEQKFSADQNTRSDKIRRKATSRSKRSYQKQNPKIAGGVCTHTQRLKADSNDPT